MGLTHTWWFKRLLNVISESHAGCRRLQFPQANKTTTFYNIIPLIPSHGQSPFWSWIHAECKNNISLHAVPCFSSHAFCESKVPRRRSASLWKDLRPWNTHAVCVSFVEGPGGPPGRLDQWTGGTTNEALLEKFTFLETVEEFGPWKTIVPLHYLYLRPARLRTSEGTRVQRIQGQSLWESVWLLSVTLSECVSLWAEFLQHWSWMSGRRFGRLA